MPQLSDDALIKSIRADEIQPLYFLFGEETQLMQAALQLLIKKVVDPAFESFNLQKFDGESISINDFQTAYEALPMMSAFKCVCVKDWNLDKLSKSDFSLLWDLVSVPNPSTVLILFYTKPEIDCKKGAGTKCKKIMSLFQKEGITCEFSLKDRVGLRKLLIARCKKAKVSLSPEVCDLLVERCGSQLSILTNEIDKLISFVGEEGTVTAEHVRSLCSQSVQNTAFDLSNAILRHEYAKAFSILDRLFYLRLEPVLILGALNTSFIDLYRIKTAQIAGFSSNDVISDFQYRSAYRVNKIYKDISKFSMDQIRICIKSLEQADRLLKSSRMDARLVLEQMLAKMMLGNKSPQKYF